MDDRIVLECPINTCRYINPAAQGKPGQTHQSLEDTAGLAEAEGDASVWGALARSFTSLSRPLVVVTSLAVLKAKYVMLLVAKKVAVALKQSMQNPSRLFRRQALSPLEAFRAHPEGLIMGLQKEFAVGGLWGVTSKALGPYVTNACIAMVMFHTYSVTQHFLRQHFVVEGAPAQTSVAACDAVPANEVSPDVVTATVIACEALAGAAAGSVQATLSAPLYNIKLRNDAGTLFDNFRFLYRREGIRGLFRNYPFVAIQESLSLAAFFGSYACLRTQATYFLHRHVDSSGKADMCAWAVAASASGMVLVAVGTPFENLHRWHVARRDMETPSNIGLHFLRSAKPQTRCRILLSGLRRKLPLAPVAGLPLLVYEAAMHNGFAPVLHEV